MPDKILIYKIDSTSWKDFKQIKIESIKAEPLAFGTSLKEIRSKTDEYWINFTTDSNNIVLLAYNNSTPIGIIRAALIDEDVDVGTAFIASLYVNANYRKSGLGKNLLKLLIEEIEKYSEIHALRLWVNPLQEFAIELYKKLGFKFVQKDSDEYIFEKILNKHEK